MKISFAIFFASILSNPCTGTVSGKTVDVKQHQRSHGAGAAKKLKKTSDKAREEKLTRSLLTGGTESRHRLTTIEKSETVIMKKNTLESSSSSTSTSNYLRDRGNDAKPSSETTIKASSATIMESDSFKEKLKVAGNLASANAHDKIHLSNAWVAKKHGDGRQLRRNEQRNLQTNAQCDIASDIVFVPREEAICDDAGCTTGVDR